ncbi:MAG: pyridoxine 5'-phosphate synthase [Nitrososphaerales archaeon]
MSLASSTLNSFFSFKLNIQIGTTPEQMHELLSISPPLATLSNLQRKDNCIDLLLFKEQIQELLQNFHYPKENLTVRIEADPEQIKVASKLGFLKAEIDFQYPFNSEKEYQKFDETVKIAQKFSVSIAFGRGMDLSHIKEILKKYKPDELIIDFPFYKIALKDGISKSIEYIERIAF